MSRLAGGKTDLKPRSVVDRSGGRGALRIIGGVWRRRRIAFPDVPGLRPTPDRVRETLFNWLGQDLAGFRCLDLYAGSGALGFEALSRGASHLVLVEHNPIVVRALGASASMLQATRSLEIIRADALEFLRRQRGAVSNDDKGPFDLVFLDPPFDVGVPPEVFELLPSRLAVGARVYLECDSKPDLPAGWKTEKSSRAGQVHYQLLRLESE